MTTIPKIRLTPNDYDFDCEIEGVVAVYKSPSSEEFAKACQMGIAFRDIVTEEFLLDLRCQLALSSKTELTADLTSLIGIIRKINGAADADQAKLPL